MADRAPLPPVVIAGAGPAGLGAARELSRRGVRALLVERAEVVGGLAATRTRDGLLLKAGVHLVHPSNDALGPLVDDLAALLGDDALRVVPTSAIHFLGRTLDYPFKTAQLVAALGPSRLAEVAAGAATARAREGVRRALGRPAVDSFEQVVRSAFGDPFYRLFFRDYTAKVLGLPCDDIAGAWARRRVPLPTGRHLLQTVLPWWRPKRVDHAHSPFHRSQLTARDGLQSLFDRMLADGEAPADVRTGTEVVRVEHAGGRLTAVVLRGPDGAEARHAAAHLVSTLPIGELVQSLDPPAPVAIRAAAARLRFRGLVFVFAVLSRPGLFAHHWTYFQDPALPFNRVSELGGIVPGLYGKDRTVVCAEITADPGEPAWNGPDAATIAATLEGLRRVSPVPFDGAVEATHVTRERFAYPAWRVGFEADLEVVLAWLDGISGLQSVGRQGRYAYLNVDEAIAEGIEAAARVARGVAG